MKSAALMERDRHLLQCVAKAMREQRELRAALDACVSSFVEHGPSRWAGIWLSDTEGAQLRLLSIAGQPPSDLPRSLHVEPNTRPENVLRTLCASQGELTVQPLVAQGVEHGILAIMENRAGSPSAGEDGDCAPAALEFCAMAIAQRVAGVRPIPDQPPRTHHDSEVRQATLDVLAHDLRNPLGALLMSATLLSRTATIEERSKKQLDILRRSASRLNDLLGDFVDLVALENGNLTHHPGAHSLPGIVKEAVERCAGWANEKSIQIHSPDAGEGAAVTARKLAQCDRERTLQACMVLLRHGIEITPRGGAITLSLRDAGRLPVVHFTFDAASLDEGSIPLLDLGYFKARHEARRRLSIELFLARGLVLVQGGQFDLQVQSEPPQWVMSMAFLAGD